LLSTFDHDIRSSSANLLGSVGKSDCVAPDGESRASAMLTVAKERPKQMSLLSLKRDRLIKKQGRDGTWRKVQPVLYGEL